MLNSTDEVKRDDFKGRKTASSEPTPKVMSLIGKKRGCLFDFHRETACQSVAIKKGGQFTILTIHFYCCNGITEALRND